VRPCSGLCGFDDTSTLEDTADALSIACLGFERRKSANEAFHAGRRSFEQILCDIFEPIDAPPEEVRAFVSRHVRVCTGFERLATTCQRLAFLIASGGLDNIRPALEKLPRALSANLAIRANHALYAKGGLALRFPCENAPAPAGPADTARGAWWRS